VPYRVVINEAIELAKTYGAEHGHKYVNSIIDGVAKKLRKVEIEAKGRG
jgi:N utilization substance protein B